VEDLGGNGPGNVYVFNLYNQDVNSLSCNGSAVTGDIPAWGANYQPNSQAVPRSLGYSPGTFRNGQNALTIFWLDGAFAAEVPIDGNQVPLNQDLLLFIACNAWQLVTQYGVQIATGPVTAVMGTDAPNEAVC